MKKLCLCFMALTLCVLSLGAMAESQNLPLPTAALTADITLPQGAVITHVIADNAFTLSEISFEDETMPSYLLTIAPSEEYAGQQMQSMNQEEIDALYELIAGDMHAPGYTMVNLDNGMLVLAVDESSEEDVDHIVTLQNGFFFQITFCHADFAPLTKEDMDAALALMNGITVLNAN